MHSERSAASQFFTSWAEQNRVLGACVATELHELLKHGGLKLFVKLIEPFIVLGVALCWHTLINAPPPYGTSRLLFLISGYYPVHLFAEVSSAFWAPSRRGSELRRFPIETMMDHVVVQSLLEALLYVIAGVIAFVGLYLYGIDAAWPVHPSWIMYSLAQMILIGFGLGLCNAQIQLFFTAWRTIWIGISRALILFSGIFYVPSLLPTYVRDVMGWNPIMQGVEAFRYGLYDGYPANVWYPLYFWSFAIGSIIIGVLSDRALRPRNADV